VTSLPQLCFGPKILLQKVSATFFAIKVHKCIFRIITTLLKRFLGLPLNIEHEMEMNALLFEHIVKGIEKIEDTTLVSLFG
jgi:hypothetical protein